MNPRPRQYLFRSVLVLLTLVLALVFRAPWPGDDLTDLRDSVSDHRAMLSAGHSAFACAACHISHAAKAQAPVWQKQGAADSMLFVRDADAAGGVKTGLCMSCHDGTVASALSVHAGAFGGARQPFQAVNLGAGHPVGVDYRAAIRLAPESYNDPVMNARIVLEDGKVGCISCHSTHDISAVSAGNVRPEVCLDCHVR